MLSADQAGTTNGAAICIAPAAAAVFSTVRRSSFVERISRFIAFLPRDFFKSGVKFFGRNAHEGVRLCDADMCECPSPTGTLMCDIDPMQGENSSFARKLRRSMHCGVTRNRLLVGRRSRLSRCDYTFV